MKTYWKLGLVRYELDTFPHERKLFCRCHLVYKGENKSLYLIVVLLLCLFAIGDVFIWLSSFCPKTLLIMTSIKLKRLQRD